MSEEMSQEIVSCIQRLSVMKTNPKVAWQRRVRGPYNMTFEELLEILGIAFDYLLDNFQDGS